MRLGLHLGFTNGTGGTAAATITTLPVVGTAPLAASGVSRVIPGYTGNLYRLVRASDSATMDIGQGVDGKADVSGVAAWIGASNAAVDIWYDQTGNLHHATQATAGNRPQWIAANAIRGHIPILSGIDSGGTASDRFLTIPATHSLQLRSNTVFHVAAAGNGPLNTWGYWSLGTATDGTAPGENFANVANGGWQTMPGFRAAAARHYQHYSPEVSMLSSSATWKNRVHKIQNSGAQSADVTLLGGRIGSNRWTSAIAGTAANLAWVTFAAQLSDTDAVLIEDALASIFTVTLAPDTQIMFEGDSITNGANNGVFMRGIQHVVGPNLSRYAGMYNVSLNGDTMAAIYSLRSRSIGAFNTAIANNLLHLWAGTNDIFFLAATTFDTRLTTANTVIGTSTAMVADATSMIIGNFVGSVQFPAGTTITNIAGLTVTCSANATATSTAQTFRAMDGALATAQANLIWTNSMLPYIQAAIAAGHAHFQIIVATALPRFWEAVSTTALYGYELTRQALNARIIAEQPTHGFTVVNYGAVAGLATGVANVPSGTYYHTDLVHPKAAGYVLMEPTGTAAINDTLIGWPPTALTLTSAAQNFNLGTSGSSPIGGSTTGSTMTASGLPTGITFNSGARTINYDGTGSLGTTSITLSETLSGQTKTRRTVLDVAIIAAAEIRDTFTDTAGTALTAHTPDIGGAWSLQAGTGSSSSKISAAGRLYNDVAEAFLQNATTISSNNVDVQTEIILLSAIATQGHGVIARAHATLATFYLAQWEPAALLWRIYKCVGGAYTLLGSSGSNPLSSEFPLRTLRLQVSGTTSPLVVIKVDGTTLLSITDTATNANLTGAGKVGTRLSGTGSSTTGMHLDNFRAGPL